MLIPSRNGPYAILEVYRSFASLLLPVQGSVLSHERQVSSRQVCTDREKRKMWLFPKVFIPATQGLMGAFLSFVWSCIERIQIQLTLWGVKLTSERRGHSRDSSWEEKHLGHFVTWERIRPNISKQWSSEAGHSAEQAALTAATTSAPMLLCESFFSATSYSSLSYVISDDGNGSAFPVYITACPPWEGALVGSVLTWEYGVHNCQWTQQGGISEVGWRNVYILWCIRNNTHGRGCDRNFAMSLFVLCQDSHLLSASCFQSTATSLLLGFCFCFKVCVKPQGRDCFVKMKLAASAPETGVRSVNSKGPDEVLNGENG